LLIGKLGDRLSEPGGLLHEDDRPFGPGVRL
jgi:hypothetical protein